MFQFSGHSMVPVGLPQYQPAHHALMDCPRPEHPQPLRQIPEAPRSESSSTLQDSQMSAQQDSQESQQAPALGWVDDFLKKANDAPAAVSKKVAVKAAAKLVKALPHPSRLGSQIAALPHPYMRHLP
jgi:hypothetical protein